MSELNENALSLISTKNVAFNAVAWTALYTVPTGKLFVPVFANVRAGVDCGETDVTMGRSTAKTDFLGTTQLDNLDADGDVGRLMPANASTPTCLKTYGAGEEFGIDVTVANGGATNAVDLFGYLIDV